MAKTKIRTQFLTLFMIIGLIPLIIIVALFFMQSSRILMENSFEEMSGIQEIKKNQLQDEINHRFDEFNSILSTDIFFNVKIENDSIIVDENSISGYDRYFSNFLATNNFYNLYILSPKKGEVLYNYLNEKGSISNTGLIRVWEKSLLTDNIVIEDFDDFNPSSDIKSAFLGKSIKDENNKVIGVIVLQITDKFIDTILKSREGLGHTGESYIITYNKLHNEYEFRSNMVSMGGGNYKVGYVWSGDILQYWKDAISNGLNGGSAVYIDSIGAKVLVKYNKLNIPSLDWYLITKVDKKEVLSSLQKVLVSIIIISALILLIIGILSVYFSNKLTTPIILGAEFADEISHGNFHKKLDINRNDEIGLLAKSLKDMGRKLEEQAWLRQGREGLDDALRGIHDVNELGTKFISFLVKHLDAQLGALYLIKENDPNNLYLTSSYAFSDRKGNYNKIAIGEGLVGQSALERNEITYTHVPTDAPDFNYGVASMIPTSYISTPLIFEENLIGVFLIGISVPVSTLQKRLINNIKNNIAILINSAKSSSVIQTLLEDAQIKQEELRVSNEELEQQTEALKDSEKDLQAQQEELRVTNEELQERTEALEKQRQIMKDKNLELETLSKNLEQKAVDLQRASQYKSEFLANMSHELRTPLNSILILSQLLSTNKKGTLDEKQVESAKAINSSGEDLLRLINEILDLSKVEAGKVDIHPEVMTIKSLIEYLERVYRPTADQKGIKLTFSVKDGIPESIVTDSHRLQQVLKNLMTNAFKFTEKDGSVTLNIQVNNGEIEFTVIDSGIGISEEKQGIVFEAFQQADGSTSRKYGGTGLGLSISKQLIKLLGGDISLKSEVGKGSSFTVSLPINQSASVPEINAYGEVDSVEVHVKDDREGVENDSKTLLIIEDDATFAAILKEQAHEKGFKVLIAEDGETGLHFADYYRPSGIILDIGLPGIDGYTVFERLKSDNELCNIPVHFMSGNAASSDVLEMGAVGYMMKPVNIQNITMALDKIEKTILDSISSLLIIEDDDIQRDSLELLISGKDVEITSVRTGKEAYDILTDKKFDCIILDLGLGDMSGYDLLDKINTNEKIAQTPIIIYTGRDLSVEEELRLKKYAESIIIKGIKSPERLLEESSLFLHRVNTDLEEAKKELLEKVTKREEVLVGKNVLVVDDDMRNIFALSNILEEKDINVIVARDGVECLERIQEFPDIDLVLMDIMMPRMDGYEAMSKIRKIKNREKLPIIALTANAMKGDRSKCIESGANDYLAKPVDNNKLISMLRVWLY